MAIIIMNYHESRSEFILGLPVNFISANSGTYGDVSLSYVQLARTSLRDVRPVPYSKLSVSLIMRSGDSCRSKRKPISEKKGL